MMSLIMMLIACNDFGLTHYKVYNENDTGDGEGDTSDTSPDLDSSQDYNLDSSDSGIPDSDSTNEDTEALDSGELVFDSGETPDDSSSEEVEEEEFVYHQTLAVGNYNYCAILSTGEIFCEGWCGADCDNYIPDSPIGTYTQISGSGSYCGIKTSGYATCFGGEASSIDGSVFSPPAEKFIDIDIGGSNACGVTEDGNITCWGYETYHAEPPSSSGWKQIAGVDGVWCALDEDGYAYCWSMDPTTVGQRADKYDDMIASPSDQFSYITYGANTWEGFCGITTEGVSKCWGGGIETPSDYEEEGVILVDGTDGVCYVYSDNSAYCYGTDNYGELTIDTSLSYDQIIVSYDLTCRIMTDGSLTCHTRSDLLSGWGNHPAGTFLTSR
jgi:hypothetical protein